MTNFRMAQCLYYAPATAKPSSGGRPVGGRPAAGSADAPAGFVCVSGSKCGGGVPPTGREFTCRMVALVLFEGDRIVCERIYFDAATILRQLGLATA